MKSEQDDILLLLDILPLSLREHLPAERHHELTEIVLDLGAIPEARYNTEIVRLSELGEVTQEDVDQVVAQIGQFTSDNRAGIERTLHRVSAIRNQIGRAHV